MKDSAKEPGTQSRPKFGLTSELNRATEEDLDAIGHVLGIPRSVNLRVVPLNYEEPNHFMTLEDAERMMGSFHAGFPRMKRLTRHDLLDSVLTEPQYVIVFRKKS